MSESNFIVTVSGKKRLGAIQWWLDEPCNGQGVYPDQLQSDGLQLNGWLVVHSARWWQLATKGILLIKTAAEEIMVPLSVARPDVVQRMLKSGDGQDQLQCGFSIQVPLTSDSFSLCYRQGVKDLLLGVVTIRSEHQVLKGKQGWLFLDNDTNGSVEQFLGRKLLSSYELFLWQRYAEDLSALAQQHHFKPALLLVPSKERVYSHFYPLKAGKQNPVDQVFNRCKSACPVVYPEQQLRNFSQPTYLKTDTHWSALGAKLGARLTAEALGFDSQQLTTLFANDQYRFYQKPGDLGSKIYPPVCADEWMLANYNFNKFVRYDNKLPNFGRVMLIEDDSALHAGTCLLFSSSSAYSMLGYLARIFKRLVLVHTAGNVDSSLLALIKPDFVITQTNARFVVKAPVTEYSVLDVIKDKLAEMPATQRDALVAAAKKKATTNTVATALHALLDKAAANCAATAGG